MRQANWPESETSSATRSSSTTLPMSISTTRLTSAETSLRRWLEISMVCPPGARRAVRRRSCAPRVEVGGRLVHDQHLRLAPERDGDQQLLLHAARELDEGPRQDRRRGRGRGVAPARGCAAGSVPHSAAAKSISWPPAFSAAAAVAARNRSRQHRRALRRGSRPSMVTRPSKVYSPSRQRISVVLPAPLEPISATRSPSPMSRLMSSRTRSCA
jgi:hypothetical protein